MTGEFKRKLDLAANASIDVVALNNQVVKMRPIVKRSKLYVINKLTKHIKKLRGKKATEEQKKRNTSRANNLVEEVKVIKVLRPDYISKYALGTTETFEKLICQPNLDMETRALARLAEHQFIQDFVQKFRAEHRDWKELTAYLMTKHTSREFKKKKPNQKLAKVATNVKATEKIVESYLGDKLKHTEIDAINDGNTVKLEGERTTDVEKWEDYLAKRRTFLFANQSSDFSTAGKADEGDSEVSDSQSDSDEAVESDMDEQNNDRLKTNRNAIKKIKKDKVNTSSDKDNDSSSDDNNDVSDAVDYSSGSNEESSDHEQADIDDSSKPPVLECKTSSSESEFDSEPNNHRMSDKDSKQRSVENQGKKGNKKSRVEKLKQNTKGNENVKKLKQKSRTNATDQVSSEENKSFIEKTSGEMIVKKINLEDWTEDSIDTETSKTVPEFLLETARQKTKRKIKDPFFSTNDESDVDSDDNEKVDINSGNLEDSENANNEFEEESEQFTGIRGLSTTFVGSLKSDRMMKCDDPQYRSNEDWKKKRHEMKARNFSEHRGRGGINRHRGRGQVMKSRGGNVRAFRDQGQNMRRRGDSGSHRGGFRGKGRGHHGQPDSQLKQEYDSLSFKQVPNSAESKSPEEKLLRPSWLKQGTMTTKQGATTTSHTSEEKLHPSWQASKKRKEQQTGIQTFQGKKIKFDD